MKEGRIVAKIIATVRREFPAAYVRKLSDRFTRGLPDLIVLFRANDGTVRFLAVEVKNENGRASPLQRVEGDEINRAGSGSRWMIARSADEVLEVMKEMAK